MRRAKGLVVSVNTGCFAHFPSMGSYDPPPFFSCFLGVKNVQIWENSEKNRGPLQPLKIKNIDKFAQKESPLGWVRLG